MFVYFNFYDLYVINKCIIRNKDSIGTLGARDLSYIELSEESNEASSFFFFLTTLPTFKKFKNLCIVKCKSKYQKWQCKCKAACVRSYCKCSPGVIRCVECYAMHHIDSEMQDLLGACLCILIFMICM